MKCLQQKSKYCLWSATGELICSQEQTTSFVGNIKETFLQDDPYMLGIQVYLLDASQNKTLVSNTTTSVSLPGYMPDNNLMVFDPTQYSQMGSHIELDITDLTVYTTGKQTLCLKIYKDETTVPMQVRFGKLPLSNFNNRNVQIPVKPYVKVRICFDLACMNTFRV